MCWPGPHQHNCEERGRHSRSRTMQNYASSDKLQCAIYYAIDGDQVRIGVFSYSRIFKSSISEKNDGF